MAAKLLLKAAARLPDCYLSHILFNTPFSELEAEHEDLLAKINITKLKLKDAERSMALKNPLGTMMC